MINVIKFPFDKWPYFLIGIKEMFYCICDKKKKVIKYENFFKYVIG
jgi:hypothetical protein